MRSPGNNRPARCRIAGLVALALTVSAQSPSGDRAPAANTDRAFLTVDVRQFGFIPNATGWRDQLSLDFVDGDHLLFAWTTTDNPVHKHRVAGLATTASHLHALLLDLNDIQKSTRHDLPVSSYFAAIRPVANGEFLVCAGQELQLLAHDFTSLKQEALPCAFRPSASEHTFVTLDSLHEQEILRDTQTFGPLAECPARALSAFTDDRLVCACGSDSHLCIRNLGGDWRPLNISAMDAGLKPLGFINNSTLLFRTKSELVVATADGLLLFRAKLPKKLLFHGAVFSAGGLRFAIIEDRMRGWTSPSLDIYAFPADDQVVVYDVTVRRAIYTRKLKGTSPWLPGHEHINYCALSPDGSLLAVEEGGTITIYRLPPPTPSS